MSKNKFIRRKKDSIKTILIILILLIGVGYAYISTNLNINGTANINSASWNVHWANVQVTSGSVSANTPTITNQTTVNYTVTLTQPGDYYEFTVDAVNSGTIDAMIDTIDSKLNGTTITTLPAYLEYSVAYSDGAELQPNQQLLHNTTETYKVRVGYKENINASDLPANNQTLSLQFTVIYKQATEEAEDIAHFSVAYTTNIASLQNYIFAGQVIPNDVVLYSTPEAAIIGFKNETSSFYERPMYLKHRIQNNIAVESYLGFLINSKVKSLTPGVTEGEYYIKKGDNAKNRQILVDAFGGSNCQDNHDIGLGEFYCRAAVEYMYNTIYTCDVGYAKNGEVYAYCGNYYCEIRNDGIIQCAYGD